MDHRDLDEIFRRLDAIERHLEGGEHRRERHEHHRDEHEHHRRRHEHHEHGHDPRDCDEKRIVDLVVRLVSERVTEVIRRELDDRFAELRSHLGERHPPPPPGHSESS